MDSPVIVDAASKFGREIDLDRSFPGFPFEDEADIFDRPRGDSIRAHLDNLAARHPDLAEHLRGPPWPFGGSLLRNRRHRRRGSGGSSNDGQQHQQPGQQHQVDEDARSQASGSSAASGASAVSSHSGGEADLTSSSAIPQYGLRNTVDIGQQQRRRNMEISPETSERGQRSMSAPPENRQQQQQHGQDQQQQPLPSQGQRFVSRVDITPQHNQQRAQSPSKPSSNVRHIPIFVEGRDEPVMSKFATDDIPSSALPHHHQRQPSPPHFHRPSHFNEHFGRQQWPPSQFQNTFYDPGFEQPQMRKHHQQSHQQQPQYYQQQPQHHQQQPQSQHHQQQPQPQHHQQQQQQTQQPQYQQQQQQQEIPKPKPPVPKDPLEKVAQVQKEVDNLAEQVRRYVGGSRQDKKYIYLDEMLTRELLKLDDIETEGRENVRLARKNTIKSIQDTISLLETKASLADQQEQQSVMQEGEECSEEKDQQEKKISQAPELMDVDVKQDVKMGNEPIPLPPAPLSPTKTKIESLESENAMAVESANQNVASVFQQGTEIDEKNQQEIKNRIIENTKQPNVIPTDETTKLAEDGKYGDMTTQDKDATLKQQTEETKEGKTESPRLQKKVKKTKKKEQQPVSEQAIPLPPPLTESTK
ncbi:BAG domain-containing protein Samui isoform X2 [Polyergus mexicanus]|uniref:BAG domain-containing protein Samui isoform X2 n=1 Tax=Polyergus mexicanus TaxID=615972 RepID=UPI0038B57F0B